MRAEILTDDNTVLGWRDITGTRWISAANGFTNSESIPFKVQHRGIGTRIIIRDDFGTLLSRGTLGDLPVAEPGETIEIPPGGCQCVITPGP